MLTFKRTAISALLGAAALALATQPALAQTKAAYAKSSAEFYTASSNFSAALAALTKRTAAASPHDKECWP